MVSAWFVVAVALTLAAGVALVVSRRRGAPSDRSRPLALVAGRVAGIAYAGLTLIATITAVTVTLLEDAVEVTVPVAQFWQGPFPWITIIEGPSATVVGGGFTHAELLVSGLDVGTRLWLAGGHAAQGITFGLIGVVIAMLCHRLLGGSPFRPALSRSVMLTAATITVGGLLWQICFGIAGSAASEQALRVTGWNSEFPGAESATPSDSGLDPFATGLPMPSFGFSIEFWPLFLGLALAAVALAFRQGERLQRDTEGLV